MLLINRVAIKSKGPLIGPSTGSPTFRPARQIHRIDLPVSLESLPDALFVEIAEESDLSLEEEEQLEGQIISFWRQGRTAAWSSNWLAKALRSMYWGGGGGPALPPARSVRPACRQERQEAQIKKGACHVSGVG
jgi:hypothetical protein